MHDQSLADAIRSRLARGQPVWLCEIGSARLITVRVHREDVMIDLIFALGSDLDDERPWKYEITDRTRSTRVATIDDVLAHLASTDGMFELRS